MGVSGVKGVPGGVEVLAIAINVPEAVGAVSVTPTDFGTLMSLSSVTNPLHFGLSGAFCDNAVEEPLDTRVSWELTGNLLSPFILLVPTAITVYEAPYD